MNLGLKINRQIVDHSVVLDTIEASDELFIGEITYTHAPITTVSGPVTLSDGIFGKALLVERGLTNLVENSNFEFDLNA